MAETRNDLSDWVLHFVHDRNESNEPSDDSLPYDAAIGYPYHIDYATTARFDLSSTSDDEHHLDPDASAFSVLRKIISDGHIRATWAFRNNRPTIYGPRAAVCLTEMPLYALISYARRRKNTEVRTYAIGVPRRELFVAGGRPVIYGLSGRHLEDEEVRITDVWPRLLATSCGIAPEEQYRYVYMNMDDPNRRIDWSHEREWRWVDHQDSCSCPGLPIWLDHEPVSFSRVCIVVETESEASSVLDLLQELHDAGTNNYDQPFDRTVVEKTEVVSLQRLRDDPEYKTVDRLRLEDVPSRHIAILDRPSAADAYVERVREALEAAEAEADQAAAEFLKTAPMTEDGRFVRDVAGWAHLMVLDARSTFVAALAQLDRLQTIPGEGQFIAGIGGLGWRHEQALSVAEAAVEGGKRVLEERFPDVSLTVWSRWD